MIEYSIAFFRCILMMGILRCGEQSLAAWLAAPLIDIVLLTHTRPYEGNSIKICYSIIKEFNAFNNNNLIIHLMLVKRGSVLYDAMRCVVMCVCALRTAIRHINEIGISSRYSFNRWMNTDFVQKKYMNQLPHRQ